jgi:hypothetical protein
MNDKTRNLFLRLIEGAVLRNYPQVYQTSLLSVGPGTFFNNLVIDTQEYCLAFLFPHEGLSVYVRWHDNEWDKRKREMAALCLIEGVQFKSLIESLAEATMAADMFCKDSGELNRYKESRKVLRGELTVIRGRVREAAKILVNVDGAIEYALLNDLRDVFTTKQEEN